MNKDEALKMAIEALNKLARLGNGDSYGNSDGNCIAIKTLKAIEEALEAEQVCQAQKPFGIYHVGDTEEESDFFLFKDSGDVSCEKCIKLYTHHHQWQGLTDDEIEEFGLDLSNPAGEFVGLSDWKIFARAIEQSLRDKNT